ncbi:MAG TPA: L,D-transpeptidase family protein [Terriglobales bacterium]|nr:L,D-transpeptidase family protein [Terriglobales bacterium]
MSAENQAQRRFYLSWIAALVVLSAAGLTETSPEPIDKVLVIKHERILQLLTRGKVVKTYKVALGAAPVGPKQRQGDHRTPEGLYILDSRNSHSQFHKSIHISYPNQQDEARAAAAHVAAGGDLYLHGLPNGFGRVGAAHRLRDWTDGCIAVTDNEIDEIWRLVKNGTPIEIKP